MARGKYKSAAEAREARESAMAEAARLRKENDALSRENARIALATQERCEALLERVAQLQAQVAAGTSSKVEELEQQVAALVTRCQEVEAEHVEQVKDGIAFLYANGEVAMSGDDWPKFAELIGVQIGDIFAATKAGGRNNRRMSNRIARRNTDARRAAEANGFV